MNEDWYGEELLDINDSSLPEALRAYGKQFKNPARFVIEVGDNEYLLYAEDGEMLDAVFFSS